MSQERALIGSSSLFSLNLEGLIFRSEFEILESTELLKIQDFKHSISNPYGTLCTSSSLWSSLAKKFLEEPHEEFD